MTDDLTSAGSGKTYLERMLYFREQATQFRQWAADETGPEARVGFLDMARQYGRLPSEI